MYRREPILPFKIFYMITPEEKAERWPTAVAAWPDYAEYQKNTDRDIPLIICESK